MCVCVCVCVCVVPQYLLNRAESILQDEVGVRERSSSLYDSVRSSELGEDLNGSSFGSWAVSSALERGGEGGRGGSGVEGEREGRTGVDREGEERQRRR